MKSSKGKETAAQKEARLGAGDDHEGEFDIGQGTKMVNVELPVWAIKSLDREATRRGVARQALIKMWLVDRLDAMATAEVLTRAGAEKKSAGAA
jgi:hypothetical protein